MWQQWKLGLLGAIGVATAAPATSADAPVVPTTASRVDSALGKLVAAERGGSLLVKSIEVIDEKGEGSDSLFRDFQSRLSKDKTLSKDQSPVVRFLLAEHENDISRAMGPEAYGKIGMRTHIGDSFFLDDKKNLYYLPNGGKPQIFLENVEKSTEWPDGVKKHALDAEPTRAASPPQASPEESPGESQAEQRASSPSTDARPAPTEGIPAQVEPQSPQPPTITATPKPTPTVSSLPGTGQLESYREKASPSNTAAPSPQGPAPRPNSIPSSKGTGSLEEYSDVPDESGASAPGSAS